MDFLQVMTPFLLASIGGLYTEYSGTTNVALEGYMTMSAFLFISISKLTGSIYLGVILTITIILLLSYIHSALTVKLKANPIITGLALNMGFFGLISALGYRIFNTKGVILLDSYDQIDTTFIMILALCLPFLTLLVMRNTTYGLRLKVRGISKKNLLYSNIDPEFYRITSMMISGLFAGLAGIYLGMELRSFIPNIGAGRGWIALVIIYLGRKHPIGILIGCIIFSGAQVLSNLSQSQAIPTDIILASPYLLTLIALILTNLRLKKNITDKTAGKNTSVPIKAPTSARDTKIPK